MLEGIRLFPPGHTSFFPAVERREAAMRGLPCCSWKRIELGVKHLVTNRVNLGYPNPTVVPRRGFGERRPDAASLAFLLTVIVSFP